MDTNNSNAAGCLGRGCLMLVLHSIWVGLLLGGLYYAYTSWAYISKGVEVDAIVVEMDINSDSDGTTYSPIFEYTYEGQTYRYNSVNASNPPTHKVGDHETLLVLPDKPSRARANSFWELWLLPAILIPVSLGTAVTMIFVNFLISRTGLVGTQNYRMINT